ncbi:double zinc ribbon domain-containing protein [Bacillus changyiensis]|uniref:double zinc ribbon domain-containing protein n=1 Tax=Bacillus changyiensis TaxID=3004103 RepID=UPI0022E7B966|nr:double zinc ribbon domain-containing protein [Bacillus changyiensis]MDA1476564.1 double zinc ribbon domain-containing protein [Bacillus changyiensis]
MICLNCKASLSHSLTWRSLFCLQKEKRICKECAGGFLEITRKICRKCGRPQDSEELCDDCLKWEANPKTRALLQQNRSVFQYNSFMKEVLARFKFRGDAELVYAFEPSFINTFQRYHRQMQLTLVPIPLSEERKKERGFNQAERLAALLKKPVIHPLTRIESEKQSKKSRAERLKRTAIFQTEKGSVKGLNIMLIDDLYTTGSTLHHAAECLTLCGEAKLVFSYTLIRS